MKCKLTPELSSGDWKDFCSRFHFASTDLPHIQAIYTALLPLVECYAYYSLDQDLDEVSLSHYAYGFVTLGTGLDELSELYLNHEQIQEAYIGDTYSLDLLPQIYERLAPDAIRLTEGLMLRPLKTATLILHLDTKAHTDLKQLCNTCATCKNLSCPSRKASASPLPHTYGAMQIFHKK